MQLTTCVEMLKVGKFHSITFRKPIPTGDGVCGLRLNASSVIFADGKLVPIFQLGQADAKDSQSSPDRSIH
jgi:hypothetical protein